MGLRSAPVVALPTPFSFGAPEFQPAAILSLCLVMLVLMTESSVPMPVLGGAGIVLFGSIAVSGIRTLSEAGLDDSSHIILVAVSLGAGIIPLAAPTFYAGFPAWAQTAVRAPGSAPEP
ncbi:hypothetical protein Sgleb_14990 [Streptomyces glebosus]|uniref:Uncharacterized protein n=1 Tax=Streptomyces glebosus TaxID=249580 RepID=A0A640SRI6_9ACTN|nr:hypothetical protein Sgleb_14990 [Streptomyces glebosus]GHG90953.1 hypothetical protein GCM10010513_74320 [Streptomyces glebosus]